MKIQAGYRIAFECPQPTPMLLMLNVHPSRMPDLITPDDLVCDPPVEHRQYRDAFGNVCTRLLAPAGRLEVSADFLIRDPDWPIRSFRMPCSSLSRSCPTM